MPETINNECMSINSDTFLLAFFPASRINQVIRKSVIFTKYYTLQLTSCLVVSWIFQFHVTARDIFELLWSFDFSPKHLIDHSNRQASVQGNQLWNLSFIIISFNTPGNSKPIPKLYSLQSPDLCNLQSSSARNRRDLCKHRSC